MNTSSLRVHSDLSAPRGPINFSALLVRALVAYSVYEHGYEGGTATQVKVTLQPRSCMLEDNGRGIGLHRDGYVAGLLEQLSGRRSSVALHGLGLAIIAMSSPYMVIESRRDGFLFRQQFAWGIAEDSVQSTPWAGSTGTCIALKIAEDAPEIDFEQVIAQIDFWCSAHPGLNIRVSCDGVPAL